MHTLLSWIGDAVSEILGDTLSSVLGFLILAVVLLVGATPIYLIMKVLSKRKTTFRQDLAEAITWRPDIQKLPESRRQFIREIDDFRSGLETFYRYFLYLVMVLATAFMIYLFHSISRDANKAFLQGYFGIGYVIVMVFLITRLVAMKFKTRRRSRGSSELQQRSYKLHLETEVNRGSGAVRIDSDPEKPHEQSSGRYPIPPSDPAQPPPPKSHA